MSNSTSLFRTMHEQSDIFIMPNPWDIGSARILARSGFKALATTSAGMAYALGKPDGDVTRQETLDHCQAIVNATPLPVSADLENGFGDSPKSVYETITAAAEIGLAGCSIEDYTGNPDSPLYERALAVERIEAACEACRSLPNDFVLTARCEGLAWEVLDLADVIERLQAFETAGADVLFAPGLDDLDSIGEVCSALTKPVNVIMQTPKLPFGVSELAEAGVKRISVGSTLAQLAYGSLVTAAQEMATQGRFNIADNAIDWLELESFFKETT